MTTNHEIAAHIIELIKSGDEDGAADLFFDAIEEFDQVDVDAIMHVARREDVAEAGIAGELRDMIRDNTDLTV